MNQNCSILNLQQSCKAALPSVVEHLCRSGLQVIPTFDLHQTRMVETGCTCPHHGTAECDCQMVVLLVYGKESQPATLVVHGHAGETSFSMVEFPGSTTVHLENTIRDILASY
jgi:hypothetical protein